MPVYAFFTRDYTTHTALWHGPLEGENVGGGAVNEVTCGSYKHITRSSNGTCRSHGCEVMTDLFSLLSRAGRSDAPSRTVPHRS